MTRFDPLGPDRWVHGHEVHPTNSWINQTATFLGSGWATHLKNMCQIGSFSPGIGVNMNHHLASFYASTVNHRCKSVKCQRDFISCNASLLRKEPIAFQNKWVATLLTTKFPLDHPSGICSSVPFSSFFLWHVRSVYPKIILVFYWTSRFHRFSLTFPGKSHSPKCCKATQDHQTTAIPLVAPHWCTRCSPVTAL